MTNSNARYVVEQRVGNDWIVRSAGLTVMAANNLAYQRRLTGGYWQVREKLDDLAQGEGA